MPLVKGLEWFALDWQVQGSNTYYDNIPLWTIMIVTKIWILDNLKMSQLIFSIKDHAQETTESSKWKIMHIFSM